MRPPEMPRDARPGVNRIGDARKGVEALSVALRAIRGKNLENTNAPVRRTGGGACGSCQRLRIKVAAVQHTRHGTRWEASTAASASASEPKV